MAQNISQQDYNADDRISAYLKGMMSADEEKQFLEELKTDKELRERAVAAARMTKAMKNVGEQNDRMVEEDMLSADKATVARIAKTTCKGAQKATKPRVLSLRRTMWGLSAAACVAVVVSMGIHLHTYNASVALGNEYYHDITFENVRGAEDEKIAGELSDLFANVKSGADKDATLDRLKTLWTVSTLDSYNDYTDYAPEIGWNLTIAYLKDNDRKQALAILAQLKIRFADNAGYIRQVDELEQKINEL